MPTRTSTRQAAVKANEAFQHKGRAETKKAAPKRKGSAQEEAPKKKREKKVGEEGQEGQPPKPTAAEENEKPSEPPKGQLKEATQEKMLQDANGEQKKPAGEVADGGEQPQKKGEASHGPELTKKSEEREESMPSNILEKGIIYFFFRSRVGIEDPESVEDVARAFIVLRPLPRDAKLGEGPIGDDENCRLLLLPKKSLPTSSSQRYMGFVEKAHTNVKTLKQSFVGEEYETKTKGERHVPSATPLAEGVYAISSTTRASHLTYIITIPSELTEVQTDLGLKDKGSFIMSSKNPKFPGPSSARLPREPEYPQEVLDDFRNLRWVPLEPKFIDYPHAQFLMIGEAQGELGKGGVTEQKAPQEESAGEELQYLEHENEVRVHPLHGEDTIFDDLSISKRDFPQVPTTWE